MRLHEWLRNKALIKAAADLYHKNETFHRMVDCLEEETPLNNPLSPTGPTADDRSHRLGMIEGYAQCLKNLKSLWTQPAPLPKTLTPTFEAPEQP